MSAANLHSAARPTTTSSVARRAVVVATLVAALHAPAARAFDVSYLHSLATNTGTVPTSEAVLSYDPEAKELYSVSGSLVRIFNESGMETYSFGPDLLQASPAAVVSVDDKLIALAPTENGLRLVRANFRGEHLATIEWTGVPAEFLKGFRPRVLRHADGKLYLADYGTLRVLVLRTDGEYVAGYDFAGSAQADDERNPAEKESAARDAERASDNEMTGFNVAPDGTMLFTVATIFKAYVVSPDGTVKAFGVRGGSPGKFNVIAGIAADEHGNIYVSDVLKCAVIVFDKDFRFLREFGYRGRKPGSMVGPVELAYGSGKLYVSQRARRGVSVFQVAMD